MMEVVELSVMLSVVAGSVGIWTKDEVEISRT